jgi:hypothetical protein
MQINWLRTTKKKEEDIRSLIMEEYKFRLRVTKLLLNRINDHEEADLDRISFDFDTVTKSFTLSESTPEPLYSRLLKLSHLF